MDRTAERAEHNSTGQGMNSTDRLNALSPGEYKLIADLEGGRAWWVPSVSRYLVEIAGPDQIVVEEQDEDAIPSRELWTDSLLGVVFRIGGHVAEVLEEVGSINVGGNGQLQLFQVGPDQITG